MIAENSLDELHVGSGGLASFRNWEITYPVLIQQTDEIGFHREEMFNFPWVFILRRSFNPGSGSQLPFDSIFPIQTTGGESFEIFQVDATQDSKLTAPKEQVSKIKSHFGFSISDAASVLHVQRPTIYQWLSGSAPRKANLHRLNEIYNLAIHWRKLCKFGLSQYLHIANPNEMSLFELLCQDNLQKEKIINMLRDIARKVGTGVRQKSENSISEHLAERGYKKLSPEEQFENLRGAGSLVSSNEV